MATITRSVLLSLLAAGVGLVTTAHTWAQEEPSSPPTAAGAAEADPRAASSQQHGIEEIVVTARRREESSQRVPISLTAVSAQTLEDLSVVDVNDIATFAPNLVVNHDSVSPANGRITLRGQVQNDTLITLDPAVGIYLDGVYVARDAGSIFDLLDIERVEVLNGPQGTLYGRNTTGGAINLVANKPSEEFEGSLRVKLGRYSASPGDASGFTHDYTGVLNIPLGDTAGLRVAFRSGNSGGYESNDLLDRKMQDAQSLAWRATLAFEPTEALRFRFVYDGSDYENTDKLDQVVEIHPDGLNPLCNPATSTHPVACLTNLLLTGGQWGTAALDGNRRRGQENIVQLTGEPGRVDSDFWGVALTSEYNLSDSITIKNITAYRELELFSSADFDGTPFLIGEFIDAWDQEQFTTEFQVSYSESGSPFDGVAGVMYLREEGTVDQPAQVFLFDLINPTGPINPFETNIAALHKSVGAFLHGSYDLSDAFAVFAGLRYTWEEKNDDLTNTLLGGAVCSLPPTVAPNCIAALSKDWSKVSWEVGGNWQANENVFAFAKVSTGFRSGGFNGRARDANGLRPFDEENLLNYEVGVKSDFLEGRARLNLTLFYTDYDDIQRSDFNTGGGVPSIFTSNAAKAKVYGGELEADFVPVESLQFRLAVGLARGRYDEFVTTNQAGQPLDFTDNRFPFAPDLTASLISTYELPWSDEGGPLGVWRVTAAGSWRSAMEFDVANFKSIDQDPFGLLDLRLDVEDVGGTPLDVAVFVDNVFDRAFRTQGNNVFTDFGFAFVQYGPPRRAGVEVSFDF